jgi:protein phosphatase 1 regulatory subunit 7
LRKNLIKKIEGIEHCTEMEELELYDNRLVKLENLTPLTNLVILDLAFNSIKEVTPGSLDTLVNLKKLYLSANKIKKIQGLDNLRALECLDMGDNRIRKIENLETLDSLKELHLAKNKIQVIENIGHLKKVYMLTLQANFIVEITGLEELTGLEQLYFQQNKIKKISGIDTLSKLEILDLAINEIETIEGLEVMGDTIDELWMNNNKISDWASIEYMGKTLKNIKGLYIACNPVYNRSDEFKEKLKLAVPCLKEVEGVPFDRPEYFI